MSFTAEWQRIDAGSRRMIAEANERRDVDRVMIRPPALVGTAQDLAGFPDGTCGPIVIVSHLWGRKRRWRGTCQAFR